MTHVASPPGKPVLIFDGDCNFCRRWISRWQETTGDHVEYLPFQHASVAERFPELSPEQCAQAVQFIDQDGAVYSGAEAVFRALATTPSGQLPLRLYQHAPGVAPLAESAYQLVANHRTAFSRLTRLFFGEHTERPSYFLTRWLFLRLLGVIYLIAFVSLWTQVDGLIGGHGIMPAQHFMQFVENWALENSSWSAHWQIPTLCWFSSSDAFLHGLCAGGAILSVLVILGVGTMPALALLWLFYLSLSVVSNTFLNYQWDALLLEVGFLAILFAPLQLRPCLATQAPPSRTALWLLRWLLFRLMFASGVVKLSSGDPVWHNLTALTFHYETQPLPTWIGWYAHQLPLWFQKLSCFGLFLIELIVPFLIFAPRRLRFVGASAFTALMILIAATGNYCFFNLLTIVLCVLLLDDAALRRFFPAGYRDIRPNSHALRMPFWIVAPVAVVVVSVTTMTLFRAFREPMLWPSPMVGLYEAVMPLRTFNGYGLFASMTTARPEIVVEGSNDGEHWLSYEFKYKPGDPLRRPAFVAPHQPRLDWQMWFEALHVTGPKSEPSPWFLNFCAHLLNGSPNVLTLLKTNPFPQKPPHYVRAMVYDYHFTDFKTRRGTGAWWTRRLLGEYLPPISLRTKPELTVRR